MSDISASSLHAMPLNEAEARLPDDNIPSASSTGYTASSASEFFDGAPELDSDDEKQEIFSRELSAIGNLEPAPTASMLSYLSLSSKEFMRDTLVKVALIVLFAAGVMRTSIPSLLYATMSVQALYSRNRASLKDLFPRLLVVFASIIAIGMIMFHVIVNEASTNTSSLLLQVLGSCIVSSNVTGRVYVSFIPDILALLAVVCLSLGHWLDSAVESIRDHVTVDAAPSSRFRSLSASELATVTPAVRSKGRLIMLLLWASGSITPMGPSCCIAFIVAFIFLKRDASISWHMLHFGRFFLSVSLLIFWIGQVFAQYGSNWNATSSASQLLYTDDITSWSFDRTLSFCATALAFVLLAPYFKPLESTGIHAYVDEFLSCNVSSKTVLTLLHCLGCLNACIWAGLGPTLLALPVLLLASVALIKCVRRKHRRPIAFSLCFYIVALQVTRTLTLSVLMAIADSAQIEFDLIFQLGLTSTEISKPASNIFAYDAHRHVLLRVLGWLSCLVLSTQWRVANDAQNGEGSTRMEPVSTLEQSQAIQAAGHSVKLWASKFSSESWRFLACVSMYFVGLARIDGLHAVIFVVAALYRPLVLLLKIVAKSRSRANLWLWSSMAIYTTTIVFFFVVFNLEFVAAPSSATWGLGLQKNSIARSWRIFLPIVWVMFVCNLLTAHSLSIQEVRSKQKEKKQRSAINLTQPLLNSTVASAGSRNARAESSVVQPQDIKYVFMIVINFLGEFYNFFMRDCFRFCVCIVMLLRGMGIFSPGVSGAPSILRHGYLIIFWMLVSVVAFFQKWNGDAAKWTTRVWTLSIVYILIVIGIRYLYYFVSAVFDFSQNRNLETDFGIFSEIDNVYGYFGADAALVVLSFVQSRLFSKLQKSGWQWPMGPERFCFPKVHDMFQNILSVHGDKGFFVSLAAASLLNGLSVIGWVWAAFFSIVMVSHTALESSWPVALVLSLLYCTLAVLAPMPSVGFPGQIENDALNCDTNCVMGFVGLQPVSPYNASCPRYPVYCRNVDIFLQILVSVCIAVSVALMRLGAMYRKQNTLSPPVISVFSHQDSQIGTNGDEVPSNESDVDFLRSARDKVMKAKADAPVDIVIVDDQKSGNVFGKPTLAMLIVLHNGFYAFSFEIVVVTTCILINFKPVDVWTSMYIVHLLICLISEDSQYYKAVSLRRTARQNRMLRLVSFYLLVFVMVARYALVLSFQREFFYLDSSWAKWLGLSFNPAVFPGMTFSNVFSCIRSHDPSEARHTLLFEYVVFATALLRGKPIADVDRSRFSFFEIYRQIGLNFDRISAFVGLVVLVFSTIRGFPSLPNLVITFLITLILTQFEPIANTNEFKRHLWLWVNIIVVVSLFVFVVMQSPMVASSSSYWGLITVLVLVVFSCLVFGAGFGHCSLPSRQVALLGLSLVATVVYIRWKASQSLSGSSRRLTHHKFLKNWIRAERTLLIQKFKRSQVLLNMAHKQQSDSLNEVKHATSFLEREVDAVESDLAKFRSEWQQFMEESNRGFIGFCFWLMKKTLAAMIDKPIFISQQLYEGTDQDYPMWMEKVWSQCASQSFRSLLYYVFASNSTAIYVLAFVINHAIQEDFISGLPLVFMFGVFLLTKPFPGPRVVRCLAYYSVFCLFFRKTFRLATAGYVIYQKNYNLTQVPSELCFQEADISQSDVYRSLSNSKWIYFSAASISDIFVIVVLQLHVSIMRTRGLDRHIDNSQLDPFVSCKREELISKFGLSPELLSQTGLRFGRHDPLARCASFRSMLRYLWNRTKVGATKFSSTNGVDYYASLFAFELVAFFMLLLGVLLVFLEESQIQQRSQTALWIGYSMLQFIMMLFGRSVYIQRSSSMHLLLHIVQVAVWFPISLMCLSNTCNSVAVAVGSQWKRVWNIVFLFIKCSYLFMSCIQFCRGYDVYRFKYGLFPDNYGALSYYAWSFYRLIPFVYELQLLVDWTSTRTTLLFEEWINVEQIMAHVFRQRCTLQYKRVYGLHSGRLLSFVKIKFLSGIGLLLVVVLILWGPLVLSVFAQALAPPKTNMVQAANLEVSLNITNITSSSSVTYVIFSIKAREFLNRCQFQDPSVLLSGKSLTDPVWCESYKALQEIQFNGYSDSIWTATPEIRSYISQELKKTGPNADKVSFSAKWDLSRQPRASSFPLDYVQTVTYIYSTPPLNEVQLRNLSTIFDTTTATATVSTSDLIPTVLEASLTTLIRPDGSDSGSMVTLALDKGQTDVNTTVQWWSLRILNPIGQTQLNQSSQSTFRIYVSSLPVPLDIFALFAGQGLLAIYSLIIGFSAARLRTFLVSDISDIWLEQSACPDHLWGIAMHIWVARNAGQHKLESDLYQQLLELLRSPESLVAIGKKEKNKME